MMIAFCYLIPNFLADKHRSENIVFINTVAGLSLRGSSVTLLFPSFFHLTSHFYFVTQSPYFSYHTEFYIEMFTTIKNF